MNILTYSLPMFLNKGEIYEYTKDNIFSFVKLKNNINISFLKEKKINSKFINIPTIDLDFCTNSNLLPVRNYIKENNIQIYHCLNNGFSLFPCSNLKKLCTIHTVLPLTDPDIIDKNYLNKYENKLETSIDLSNKIIVPFNYIKSELTNHFNLNNENIVVIPPIVSSMFTDINNSASKIYVKSKFKINFSYLIYTGEINPRNDLIETLNIFYIIYMSHRDLKLILCISYLNKNKNLYLNLLSYIEQLNIQDNVIVINNFSDLDKMHLINNSLCFLYLNQYNELNLTLLQCLALNTRILCYPNESNLESLENYPIYYNDSMNLEDILENPMFDDLEKEFILNKYDCINNVEELYNLYLSLI